MPLRWRKSCSAPTGLLRPSGTAKLVVDFSSIHPDAARSIAARLKAATGMGWIDAPVSGGTKGAEEGSLAVMAGGDAADIERARPYVLAMARRFTHMGPTGAGQTTKLCNQVIAGCAMAVLAEATRLASNAGIDATKLPEALAGGFADSIPLQLFVPRMAQGIHSPPLGHIATILKDLDTVVERGARHLDAGADGGAGRAVVQNGESRARRGRRRAGDLQIVGEAKETRLRSSLRGALATKQSILPQGRKNGLLRFARNDGLQTRKPDRSTKSRLIPAAGRRQDARALERIEQKG